MQSVIDAFHARDAEVVAISVDPIEDVRRMVDSYGLTFPVLSDTDLRAIDAFGVRHETGGLQSEDIARPATFVIDREGRIAWRKIPDNWRVRVRPETLLETLDALP